MSNGAIAVEVEKDKWSEVRKNKPIEVTMRNVLAKCYDLKDIPNIINEIQLTKDKENFEDEKVKKIIYENFFWAKIILE